MHGTIGWNLAIGGASGILTFLISITNNVFLTSLIQASYAFGIMFLVAFVFRFLVGMLISINVPASTTLNLLDEEYDAPQVGQNVSLSTGDADDYLQEIIKQNYTGTDGANAGFQPLSPTRLSTAPETQADPLVEAVRTTMRQE